jgi:hypothetical protein
MFVLQGNDENRLKTLCGNTGFKDLIVSEPGIHLFVRDSGDWFREEFPAGVDELVLEVEGEVKHLERLKRLYALFSNTIHVLCHIGSAYEDDPDLVA